MGSESPVEVIFFLLGLNSQQLTGLMGSEGGAQKPVKAKGPAVVKDAKHQASTRLFQATESSDLSTAM